MRSDRAQEQNCLELLRFNKKQGIAEYCTAHCVVHK